MKYKYYKSVIRGEKIPRKAKKSILGTKMPKSKITRLLKSVRLGEPIKTMFERREIYPYAFCPKCGCKDYVGHGNRAGYPEHWESFTCIKCHNLVGYIDNSPFIHALECPPDYDPSF